MKNIVKIKRALISISDKSFLKSLLFVLSKYKIEIITNLTINVLAVIHGALILKQCYKKY